jgi:uncharacterized tellurite resistance protein B-like protein
MTDKKSKTLDDSLFNMWRCVIAIAHADGKVQDEERDYLTKIIANLDRVYGLSEEQRSAFAKDLAQPAQISEFLPKVTNPAHRSQLIYFGENLVWADGELSAEEEAVVKMLRDAQMSAVDVEKLRSEVRRELVSHQTEYGAERQKARIEAQKRNPMFGAFDRLLLKLGIDILD